MLPRWLVWPSGWSTTAVSGTTVSIIWSSTSGTFKGSDMTDPPTQELTSPESSTLRASWCSKPGSILTQRSIRRRYATGEVSLADLAEEYSVGRSTIHRAIHRNPS